MEPHVIKVIIPAFCPHCAKEIFVKVHSLPPSLASILGREDVNKAKMRVIDGLTGRVSEEELKRIRKEIMSEDIVFGPEDVDQAVESYLKK